MQELVNQYPELSNFAPTIEMCCVYMRTESSDNCNCKENIRVNWEHLVIISSFKVVILTLRFQMMDIYLAEAFAKIIDVLRKRNFESNAIDCSTASNGTDLATVSKPASIIKFEEAFNEHVATTRLLQMYKNSTNIIEYYLKVSVFGRDGNEMAIVSDESPVLTELAKIDNSEFILTPNVSLTAPKRFFRIGIGHVTSFKN